MPKHCDYDVDAAIPKFKSEYSIELKDALQNMGMTDAFDEEQADFRGIGTSDNGNIYHDMVLHKTYIEVDEQGTKAGASTVVEMAETMSLYEPEIKRCIWVIHLSMPSLTQKHKCQSFSESQNQGRNKNVPALYEKGC